MSVFSNLERLRAAFGAERETAVEQTPPPLAPITDHAVSRNIAMRLRLGQLDLIDRAARTILGNVIAAFVVAYVVYRDAGLLAPTIWLIVLCSIAIALLARVEWHRRRAPARVGHAEMKRRLMEHVVFSTSFGVLWSAFLFLVAPMLSDWGLIIVSLTMIGCVSASVSATGPSLPVFFGYYLAATPPLVVLNYFHGGAASRILAPLIFVYGITIAFNALALNRSVLATLRLRARNEVLADRLAVSEAATASATRSKWESFAHLSHELRTPMNAVLGFSDMMRQKMFGDLSDRYAEYANNIHSSGATALDLIDSILEVSRARTGTLSLVESTFDPASLVQEVVHDFEADAAQAGIKMEAHIRSLGIALHADRDKIRQVLSNLLSNALQYTAADGRVTVDLCHGHNGYCITIADTGIGIAADEIALCQEPFVRLGDPLVARGQGAGLGLPIARHHLEAHGGSLSIESRLGIGTAVTFSLPGSRCVPLEEADQQPSAPEHEPDATPFLRLIGRA
jgi:signal transduction histidine kinase